MFVGFLSLIFLFVMGAAFYFSADGPNRFVFAILGATMMATPFILLLVAIAYEVEKIEKLLKKATTEEKKK